MDITYRNYVDDISRFIPGDRIYTDGLRRFAWGTDASFYRRTPEVVIRSASESEVSRLLETASRHNLPGELHMCSDCPRHIR